MNNFGLDCICITVTDRNTRKFVFSFGDFLKIQVTFVLHLNGNAPFLSFALFTVCPPSPLSFNSLCRPPSFLSLPACRPPSPPLSPLSPPCCVLCYVVISRVPVCLGRARAKIKRLQSNLISYIYWHKLFTHSVHLYFPEEIQTSGLFTHTHTHTQAISTISWSSKWSTVCERNWVKFMWPFKSSGLLGD